MTDDIAPQNHKDVTTRANPQSKELEQLSEQLKQLLCLRQELFQELVDHIPYPIYVRAHDAHFLCVNRAFATLFGTTASVLLSTSPSTLVASSAELRSLEAADRAVLQGHESAELCADIVILDADAQPHTFFLTRIPGIQFADDDHALLVVAVDVSKYRRTTLAQQVAGIGYWDWDLGNNQLCWSDEIYRIFGIAPEQFGASYDAFLNSVHPEDRERVMAAVNDALENSHPYSIDHRIIRPDGKVRTVHEQGFITRDDNGKPTHMLGTVQDISPQKLAEDAMMAVASLTTIESIEAFYQACASHLTRTYDTRFAYVGIFADKRKQSIRTLVLRTGDTFVDNFEYSLAGTPCQDVLDLSMEFIPEGAANLYPDDEILTQMGVESYFGAPLIDSHGELLGLVGVMDTAPMQLNSWTQPVLGIFAKRIALELERQSHLDKLSRTEQFLDNVIENIPVMVCVKDARDLSYVRVNRSGQQLIGLDQKDLIGKTDHDLFPKEQAEALVSLDHRAHQSGMAQDIPLYAFHSKDLGERTIHTQKIPLFNETGEIEYLLSIGEDITERIKADEELRLTASVFEHSLEGIIITDAQAKILRVNPAFTDITGYSEAEAIGKTPRLIRSDHHDKAFYDELWKDVENNGYWTGEIWNRRKSGEVYPEWRNISAIKDQDGNVIRYISIFTDITEKKLSEERIHRLAHFDVITELPNRSLFNERLEQALVQAVRQDRKLAVMYLDLDGFKLINDTLGHPTGDVLLQLVAERLNRCIRSGDSVARLGGDEFAILLNDLAHRSDSAGIAEKVLDAVAQPYPLEGHEAIISTSIGISVFPGNGHDVATLIRHADAAMYKAKETGKNTYRYYTSEMNAAAMQNLTLRNDLRLALERNELSLHYQPQVNMKTGEVFGAEALARWTRANGESIPPGRFIPVAEESGLIIALGIWVIRSACTQLKAWHDAGHSHLHMAINLSRRQFNDTKLVEGVRAIIEATQVDPHHLEFEITESFLMENPTQTADILQQFKAMGIEISIDDFGIAYSSLSQLKHFNIDRLKIDRSFVRDIPADKDDEAITSAIIAMGHSLNLRVIAEGVETLEQLEFLNSQFCDELQGFYFSKPLPAKAFLDLINNNKTLYD